MVPAISIRSLAPTLSCWVLNDRAVLLSDSSVGSSVGSSLSSPASSAGSEAGGSPPPSAPAPPPGSAGDVAELLGVPLSPSEPSAWVPRIAPPANPRMAPEMRKAANVPPVARLAMPHIQPGSRRCGYFRVPGICRGGGLSGRGDLDQRKHPRRNDGGQGDKRGHTDHIRVTDEIDDHPVRIIVVTADNPAQKVAVASQRVCLEDVGNRGQVGGLSVSVALTDLHCIGCGHPVS